MAENVDPNKTLRFADSPAGPSGLPPKTPGASVSKKRKRSAASVAHDKDVNSKKCKTYKLYQLLLYCNWIKDAICRGGRQGPSQQQNRDSLAVNRLE